MQGSSRLKLSPVRVTPEEETRARKKLREFLLKFLKGVDLTTSFKEIVAVLIDSGLTNLDEVAEVATRGNNQLLLWYGAGEVPADPFMTRRVLRWSLAMHSHELDLPKHVLVDSGTLEHLQGLCEPVVAKLVAEWMGSGEKGHVHHGAIQMLIAGATGELKVFQTKALAAELSPREHEVEQIDDADAIKAAARLMIFLTWFAKSRPDGIERLVHEIDLLVREPQVDTQ